jgi:hypothetical protein
MKLGRMLKGVFERVVERLFLVHTRALSAIVIALMGFTFPNGNH